LELGSFWVASYYIGATTLELGSFWVATLKLGRRQDQHNNNNNKKMRVRII
jgi:hypothetical protein